MSFKTDYQGVAGLGSAKDGTGHWISQRLTAIALIPLGAMFIYPFMKSLGAGYEAVVQTYQHPFNALIAMPSAFSSSPFAMPALVCRKLSLTMSIPNAA
ncbi:MAG: hypothetical protein GXP03_02350 [Alphaproteobacteria bacterium]|nr:hypothetical protein [Alphaproteobacteria bacterium]